MSLDGCGVVFPGSPGRGKSTLASGLLLRGWSYLSDEFALLDPRTRLLTPYPKALCIKAGAFETLLGLGFPLNVQRQHRKGSKGRVAMVDPLRVRRDAVSAPCPLRMVVIPEYRRGQRPVLAPVSRAQAVFELMQQSFNFGKFRARGLEVLVEAVRQADCYRLHTGDLMESCALIEAAVRERRRAVG
jgi:hypothetical protein